MNLKLKAKILLGTMLLTGTFNLSGIKSGVSAVPPMLPSGVECPFEKAVLEDTLFQCVAQGRARDIALLMMFGVNFNARNENGHTVLHVAVMKKHMNVVRALLDVGMSIDALDGQGNTALVTAVLLGNNDIAKLLLERGADPNVLSGAVPEVASCERLRPLHIAVITNNLDLVKLLLDYKADPNAYAGDGTTPLHLAAVRGYVDIATTLLIGKSHIDAVTMPTYSADGRLIGGLRVTALDLARVSKKDDVVRLLTEAWNIVNKRCNSN